MKIEVNMQIDNNETTVGQLAPGDAFESMDDTVGLVWIVLNPAGIPGASPFPGQKLCAVLANGATQWRGDGTPCRKHPYRVVLG